MRPSCSRYGKHRKQAHFSALATLTFSGVAGLNQLKVTKVHGRKLAVDTYEAKVSSGGAAHALRFTVKR
jgi:hypothetical protein